MSQLTSMISDGVALKSLLINNKTDILLVALSKKNKTLFDSILKRGYPSKDLYNFCYIHHAIRTMELYYVEQLIQHYKKVGLNINEINNGQNCSNIANSMMGMPESIIDLLKRNEI